MKNSIFETKEQYFAMRAQWAASSKSTKCKSTLVPTDEYLVNNKGMKRFSKGTGVMRVYGWMKAEHHILYNILRDKHPHAGFTKPTKNVESKKYNLIYSHINLINRHQEAKELCKKKPVFSRWLNPEKAKDFNTKRVMTFLAPFGDTLTMQQFASMDIPTYSATTNPPVTKKETIQYNTNIQQLGIV